MKHRKGGQNLRLARLLGWLSVDNQIKANIPNKDRSVFSCEKYKFFLDADFEISNKCCKIMKKEPARRYEKDTGCKPMTAQMAAESRIRKQKWIQRGCNAFDAKNPISNPMAFWTENDVLEYIFEYLEKPLKYAWANIENLDRKKRKNARKYLRKNNYRKTAICSVYGDVIPEDAQLTFADLGCDYAGERTYKTTGCKRTGCMLCGFGCHLEKSPNRFEQLKKTHPGVYGLLDKVKNNGVTFREAIEWTNEHGNLDIKL